MKITDNKLYLGDIPVDTIMQEYGSPLYVYEESVLRSQFRKLSAGFPRGLLEIHYAMKANSNPSLLSLINSPGLTSRTSFAPIAESAEDSDATM